MQLCGWRILFATLPSSFCCTTSTRIKAATKIEKIQRGGEGDNVYNQVQHLMGKKGRGEAFPVKWGNDGERRRVVETTISVITTIYHNYQHNSEGRMSIAI